MSPKERQQNWIQDLFSTYTPIFSNPEVTSADWFQFVEFALAPVRQGTPEVAWEAKLQWLLSTTLPYTKA